MIIQLLLVTEDNSISTVFHREDAPPTLEVVGEVDLPAAALPLPLKQNAPNQGRFVLTIQRQGCHSPSGCTQSYDSADPPGACCSGNQCFVMLPDTRLG